VCVRIEKYEVTVFREIPASRARFWKGEKTLDDIPFHDCIMAVPK